MKSVCFWKPYKPANYWVCVNFYLVFCSILHLMTGSLKQKVVYRRWAKDEWSWICIVLPRTKHQKNIHVKGNLSPIRRRVHNVFTHNLWESYQVPGLKSTQIYSQPLGTHQICEYNMWAWTSSGLLMYVQFTSCVYGR